MSWNQNKSVILSKVCVIFFALLLLTLDVLGYYWVKYLVSVSKVLGGLRDGIVMMIVLYACSVPAWMTLKSLWNILGRIGKENVFVMENVKDMRRTSWCCMIVAAICLLGSWIYPTLLVLAAAAAFMGLIVRIVKNIFEQAVSMKDELDFTV